MNKEHLKILKALSEFKAAESDIVREMGNIALNKTLKSFRKQGFEDTSLQGWQPRKRTERGRGSRGILIGFKSGNTGMRNSFSLMKLSQRSIELRNSKVYSGVHNEGLRAGRGTGFKMPERRMMGKSHILDKRISKMIGLKILKIWPKQM